MQGTFCGLRIRIRIRFFTRLFQKDQIKPDLDPISDSGFNQIRLTQLDQIKLDSDPDSNPVFNQIRLSQNDQIRPDSDPDRQQWFTAMRSLVTQCCVGYFLLLTVVRRKKNYSVNPSP